MLKMNDYNNPKLTPNAKTLRKNMTPQERHLWYDYLKNLPFTVNRQKVIGKYIVDFYIACAKIVIEIDGSQHYETDGKLSDYERDEYLKKTGLQIIRISNHDINTNFDGVCEYISEKIKESGQNDIFPHR